MGLLGLYMGKVTRVLKKMVGSSVFLKLVRPLVFSDPACAGKRVKMVHLRGIKLITSLCITMFLLKNDIR